jgi:predicted AlkP superfamily phosphohydrolase/phosphomutase
LSKIVVLGIDALDAALIERWKDDLPNFRRIIDEGYSAPLESTMPPDSIPAWVTIYTGMQPWQHGIVDSMDYLSIRGGGQALDTSVLIGKTFWDVASAAGKRVCVINPLLAYPVWPVNGIMVNGPVFITGEAQSHPPEILDKFDIPELGGMADFPGKKDLSRFLRRTDQVTRDQARFGLELMALEEWDVFFLCFLTLDRVMHFLWRYTDPKDPTYPGPNPLEESIKDFFRMFDSVVGDFIDRLSPEQALLIVSDHGHGMRPVRAFYANEILRREGLLKTRSGSVPGLSPVALIEKTKNAFLKVMQRLDLEDQVYRIASLIPKDKRKQLKTSSYALDRDSSTAWVSEVGGGTSFGGIEINRDLLGTDPKAYETLRDRLIDIVASAAERDGTRVARWVKRREDVFKGAAVEKYPDVLFDLRDEYGVDRTVFCGTFGMSATHKKVSGGHSKYGTLMLYRAASVPADTEPHISSVFDLVKQNLGLGPAPKKIREPR